MLVKRQGSLRAASQLAPAEDFRPHTGCQRGLLRHACAGVVAAPLLLGLRVVHQHYIQSLGRQLLEVAQPRRVQVTVDDAVAQIQNRLQDTSCRLEQAPLASPIIIHKHCKPKWHMTGGWQVAWPYECCPPAEMLQSPSSHGAALAAAETFYCI